MDNYCYYHFCYYHFYNHIISTLGIMIFTDQVILFSIEI